MSVPKTIFTPAFRAFWNETPWSATRSAVALAVRRVGRGPVVIVRGQRGAVPRTLLHHLGDLRVGNFQAMFNRVATAIQSALQTDAVVSVTSYFPPPAVSFVHDRLQFFDGESGLRDQFAMLSHPGAMSHVNLDPVGAVVKLFARRLPRLDRAVDNLRSLGHDELGSVALKVVASGSGDGASHHEHPRSGNVAAFDRLLDSHIAITRAFSLQIADRGKALLQGAPGRDRGPRRAQCQRISENVGVVAALRRVFSLQEDMGMRVDQAGQYGGVREIDGGRTRGNFGGGSVRNAFNTVASNHDHLIPTGLVGFAVNENACTDDGHGRRRCGLGENG